MGERRYVRSVERAFRVLEVVNRGPVTATEAGVLSGLPRTTTVRLLYTMEKAGYLFAEKRRGTTVYFVNENVRRLSAGVREYISDYFVITPLLKELCQDVEWPIYLTVSDGFELEVLYGTEDLSPFHLKDSLIGARLPIFGSASGIAFLAACSHESRVAILNRIGEFVTDQRQLTWVEDSLAQAQRRGWSSADYYGFAPGVANTTSMAVGLRNDGTCIGTITMRYYSTAVEPNLAAQKWGNKLMEFSDKCSIALECASVEKCATGFS